MSVIIEALLIWLAISVPVGLLALALVYVGARKEKGG